MQGSETRNAVEARMARRIQRKLDAGDRVRVFIGEHPGTEPGIKKLEEELEQATTKALALARTQFDADHRRSDRTAWRKVVRQNLRQMLKAIGKIGKAASAEKAELGPIFAAVPGSSAYSRLRPAAEVILKAAREQRELLDQYGLDPELLEAAEQALANLIKAGDEAERGRQERIGAVAELGKAARQVVSVIARLDARNRHRWADSPELLSAWIAAARVEQEAGPAVTPESEGTTMPTSPPSSGGGEAKSA